MDFKYNYSNMNLSILTINKSISLFYIVMDYIEFFNFFYSHISSFFAVLTAFPMDDPRIVIR